MQARMMKNSIWNSMGRLAAALLVTGLGACSSGPENEMAAQGWWSGDRVAGEPRIQIDLSRQVVKYFKGGKLVGAAPISSGREGHGTVRGTYKIIEKDADHRSSVYGSFVDGHGHIVEGDVDSRRDTPPPGTRFLGASMRSFMRITGGIGMHEGYLPGFAASHGCIRLPSRMAAIFYRATPLGTPVEIIGTAPEGHQVTWLPVPHKLHRDDIVIAPRQEEDTRPKARVAIAEPPPPPAPPKPVEKPAPPKVEVAELKPKKGSFWGGFRGDDEAKEPATPKVIASKPAPAPVVASVTPPVAKAEPEKLTLKRLDTLVPQKSSWGQKSRPTPEPVRKAPKGRGQTVYLPGYD
jgi:hypothetical protein